MLQSLYPFFVRCGFCEVIKGVNGFFGGSDLLIANIAPVQQKGGFFGRYKKPVNRFVRYQDQVF